MRPAVPEEVAPLLEARIAPAMFPLANLARYGSEGHPRSMRFWRDGDAVPGLSEKGMAMPLFPAGQELPGLRAALAGRRAKGVVGESGSVRALVAAPGLEGEVPARHLEEPQVEFVPDDLAVPEGPGLPVPVSEDRVTAAAWRAAHEEELETSAGIDPPRSVDRWIAEDSQRVLAVGGRPVALKGLNARLPGIGQVGGVYVPPRRRRQGWARRAVDMHLAQARRAGAFRAMLCAASAAAAAAYRELGFRQTGHFGHCLLPEPMGVAP